ncbi:hypothetical protein [Dehalobacterium formicoaceticum]|uniref:Lipoprotein n=1 Tax=Dehalobacterium formicoaceticum TaxID=51515 RepID=A0ABT1Y0G5_9FIRM|nr:hypothetical protein [Dehalobacterium formicoaceticum]MCR6544356.1 hypothetical protein [Dehalobacterium formicoaceticum]
MKKKIGLILMSLLLIFSLSACGTTDSVETGNAGEQEMGYYSPEEAQEKMDSTVGEYVQRKGWDKLKAVQNNNVFAFFHNQAQNQFGFYPTLKMAKIFYPNEFEDINPDERLKEFYDRFLPIGYDDGVWFYQLGEQF